jgi:hypothetical protein
MQNSAEINWKKHSFQKLILEMANLCTGNAISHVCTNVQYFKTEGSRTADFDYLKIK